MKPSWDEAPEWARWLSMDASGDWYWYEDKPIENWRGQEWQKNYRSESRTSVASQADEWYETLEERPCSPPPSP
jgi:hypothetical protein